MSCIDLEQDGAILFLGTMNAMPMMYALELKKRKQDVFYLVNVPFSAHLSRPENHFPSISYPYPNWIIESKIYSRFLLVSLFPNIFFYLYMRELRKKWRGKIKAVFLSGQFVVFSKFFSPNIQRYFLSYGSDIEQMCNLNSDVSHVLIKKNFFVRKIWQKLYKIAIKNNFNGASNVDSIIGFPKGFSVIGDSLVSELCAHGISYFERHDISFEPVMNEYSPLKERIGKTIILSPVRFFYKNLHDAKKNENKGNDLIIEGLSKYYQRNKEIEIHFFEKGPHVDDAKILCKQLGLDKAIIWHKEMPFKDLIKLYKIADICFDQVGKHWVGAVGAYAIYLGKPLIANVLNWPFREESPVMQASNSEDIFDALIKLESQELVEKIYSDSPAFAYKYLGPNNLLNKICKQKIF